MWIPRTPRWARTPPDNPQRVAALPASILVLPRSAAPPQARIGRRRVGPPSPTARGWRLSVTAMSAPARPRRSTKTFVRFATARAATTSGSTSRTSNTSRACPRRRRWTASAPARSMTLFWLKNPPTSFSVCGVGSWLPASTWVRPRGTPRDRSPTRASADARTSRGSRPAISSGRFSSASLRSPSPPRTPWARFWRAIGRRRAFVP